MFTRALTSSQPDSCYKRLLACLGVHYVPTKVASFSFTLTNRVHTHSYGALLHCIYLTIYLYPGRRTRSCRSIGNPFRLSTVVIYCDRLRGVPPCTLAPRRILDVDLPNTMANRKEERSGLRAKICVLGR